jgi:hypothetical protein
VEGNREGSTALLPVLFRLDAPKSLNPTSREYDGYSRRRSRALQPTQPRSLTVQNVHRVLVT